MKSSPAIKRRREIRLTSLVIAIAVLIVSSIRLNADTGNCGGGSVTLPFTDVPASNVFFCSIASAFFSGLTNGTDATHYNPSGNVPREQMAAFVSRTLEQSIRRNNIRALTKKWYLPPDPTGITLVSSLIGSPEGIEFDGTDVWVAGANSDELWRIRPSDGKVLEIWTNAEFVKHLVCGRGRIFATGSAFDMTRLYFIDPTQTPGAVSVELTNLPGSPRGIAFDGARVWTANGAGSVSIISFNPTTANTVTTGFSTPSGILFDGQNIWVTDEGLDALLKLDASGAIIQSISIGNNPSHPVFDGINIWVPISSGNSVKIVRVKDTSGNPLTTPFVLATLTGNGLAGPYSIAFDGERMLVTNSAGNSVSLFKAADFSPLGSISTGANSLPTGACSDGMNFWISLKTSNRVARF